MLSTRQKAGVLRLRPKALAIARRYCYANSISRRRHEGFAAHAMLTLVESVLEFDGRGSLDAFALDRVAKRLVDLHRHAARRANTQKAAFRTDDGRGVEQIASVEDNVRHDVDLREAVDLLRRKLTAEELAALRRGRGKRGPLGPTLKRVLCLFNCVRRVYGIDNSELLFHVMEKICPNCSR